MSGTASLPRWLLAALGASLTVIVLASVALALVSREPALKKFGQVPAFQLVDQTGAKVTEADLAGRITAVSFIYTSCTDICPMITTIMGTVQDQLRREGLLGADVQLVSISVDPERDTPDVLARYAKEHGADTDTWRFLTGSVDEIRNTVVTGFMLGMTKHAPAHAHGGAATSYEVEHSGRVVLVDQTGQIRAYYEGTDLNPATVAADIRKLR